MQVVIRNPRAQPSLFPFIHFTIVVQSRDSTSRPGSFDASICGTTPQGSLGPRLRAFVAVALPCRRSFLISAATSRARKLTRGRVKGRGWPAVRCFLIEPASPRGRAIAWVTMTGRVPRGDPCNMAVHSALNCGQALPYVFIPIGRPRRFGCILLLQVRFAIMHSCTVPTVVLWRRINAKELGPRSPPRWRCTYSPTISPAS